MGSKLSEFCGEVKSNYGIDVNRNFQVNLLKPGIKTSTSIPKKRSCSII